jgi:hypothetical protein
VDLSIRNVRGIYRADFSPFPKGEMGTGFGLPSLFQHRSLPCCRTGKQVAFKVLNTLLPPHPVTALFPVEEHLPIGKYFIRWPKAINPPELLALLLLLPSVQTITKLLLLL